MCKSERIQSDASSVSKMEVVRVIGFLERHKIAGLDGRSPPFISVNNGVNKTPGIDVRKRTDFCGRLSR